MLSEVLLMTCKELIDDAKDGCVDVMILQSVIERFFYILHRRRFVPHNLARILCFMAMQMAAQRRRHETYLRSYLELSGNEIFLDIGASRGLYTCYMAPRCKHVYAWEPNPQTFTTLLANSKKYSNVTFYNSALGDTQGCVSLYLHFCSEHDSLIRKVSDFLGKYFEVKVKPLDSYSFEGKIGLVKIDTEGFEVPVIKGALKTIRKHKPRLIIEVHEPCKESVKEIKTMLPSYGWVRVYRRKLVNKECPFHLIGEEKSESKKICHVSF